MTLLGWTLMLSSVTGTTLWTVYCFYLTLRPTPALATDAAMIGEAAADRA